MRVRLLGFALIALVTLGAINLVQAFKRSGSHDGPDRKTTVIAAGLEDERVMVDRSFSVASGQRLLVDVQHADLVIETADVSEARIVVTLTSPDMDRAVERFEAMRFESGSDGSGVFLTSQQPNGDFFSGFWNNLRFSIRVKALIPREFDLELASTHGDVALQALTGDVRIETTHGDFDAQRITGNVILIQTTHGDLTALALEADRVELQTTHGEIAIDAVTAGRFEAETTHSDVTIRTLTADAEIGTTHGDVDISVAGTGGLRIGTTHGSVSLDLPKDLAATLDLQGDPVHVQAVGSFEGERDERRVFGTLHGGGTRVEVSTSHGSVDIRN